MEQGIPRHGDPISNRLMSARLGDDFYRNQCLREDADHEFRSVTAIASRKKDLMTSEGLSRLCGIGIKTTERTLSATTHQCIRELGTLKLEGSGLIRLTCSTSD